MSSALSTPEQPSRGAPSALRPFVAVGGTLIAATRDMGGLAILAFVAARAAVAPRGEALSLRAAVCRNLDRILLFGMPLVAIIHVGLGSFLAMQAYFGATFVDGIGPVVGVGLVRNLAPLMTGLILAGIVCPLYSGELRDRATNPLLDEPESVPDRDVLPGSSAPSHRTEAARLVAVRLLATGLAGILLALWASAVGIVVGWAVGRSMLGVTTPGFFDLFVEMLWVRDVTGLACKGMLFGMFGALFGCYEGLRLSENPHMCWAHAACRAACVSGVAILFINSAWFLLFYHAGPAFGPTVLAPPHL